MDSASVGSTTSVSNAKVLCPVCASDIQAKALFNHLFKKHREELELTLESESIQEMCKKKLPFVAYNTNGQSIRGCLGCYKGYNTDEKAKEHFQKDPECFKKHTAELQNMSKLLLVNDNDVWRRLLAFFLVPMDHWLTDQINSGYAPFDALKTAVKLLVSAKARLEDEDEIEETNWQQYLNVRVGWLDKVSRDGGGTLIGFMEKVGKFKWLPSTKELNVLLPRTITIPTVLKCVDALEKYQDKPDIEESHLASLLTAIYK